MYVVEDDEAVRLSLQTAFSTLPNTLVWGFRSGEEFLERAPELSSGCVLLDYHLPGTTGLDVLKKLRQLESRHMVIMLTGHGDVAIAVEAMKTGAFDFLEKPCDFPVLMEQVERAFSSLSHEIAEQERAKAAAAKLELLSARELEVLLALMAGDSNKLIAHKLNISPRTVEIHRAKMTEKLGGRNLSDALRIAYAGGLMAKG